MINLINHPYANYFCQIIFDKTTTKNRLVAIKIILANIFELSKTEVSLRSTSAILDNDLEEECQKEIAKQLKSIPDQSLLNNRILKLLEPILNFKRKYTLFLENFIFRNFAKLLKIRQGYFLLRKLVKNAKDNETQLKIVDNIIKIQKDNFNNVNGSLLGQCLIMNFQLHEVDENMITTENTQIILDTNFDDEFVYFKDFLKSNNNGQGGNQILSIKDNSKQPILDNKIENDYFRRKLIEKNKKLFDKKYIIIDSNIAVIKFLDFAVDHLLTLNHNKHSFKLINAIINYCRKDFQDILLSRFEEIYLIAEKKSKKNLKQLLLYKLINSKKGINILIDCVKAFNEEGNIRLNQAFNKFKKFMKINKEEIQKLFKEETKCRYRQSKELYIKEKNIELLKLFKDIHINLNYDSNKYQQRIEKPKLKEEDSLFNSVIDDDGEDSSELIEDINEIIFNVKSSKKINTKNPKKASKEKTSPKKEQLNQNKLDIIYDSNSHLSQINHQVVSNNNNSNNYMMNNNNCNFNINSNSNSSNSYFNNFLMPVKENNNILNNNYYNQGINGQNMSPNKINHQYFQQQIQNFPNLINNNFSSYNFNSKQQEYPMKMNSQIQCNQQFANDYVINNCKYFYNNNINQVLENPQQDYLKFNSTNNKFVIRQVNPENNFSTNNENFLNYYNNKTTNINNMCNYEINSFPINNISYGGSMNNHCYTDNLNTKWMNQMQKGVFNNNSNGYYQNNFYINN